MLPALFRPAKNKDALDGRYAIDLNDRGMISAEEAYARA